MNLINWSFKGMNPFLLFLMNVTLTEIVINLRKYVVLKG